MTTIISARFEDSCVIGSDSCSTHGETIQTITQPKILLFNEAFAGGISGYQIYLNALHSLTFPAKRGLDSNSFSTYISEEIVPLIKEHLSKRNLLEEDNGIESLKDGAICYATDSEIGVMGSWFSITVPILPFVGTGSGRQAALGCLYGTFNQYILNDKMINKNGEWYMVEPDDNVKCSIIHTALLASSEFAEGVRPPFNIFKLSKKGVQVLE